MRSRPVAARTGRRLVDAAAASVRSESARRGDVQGLRAVAVLLVVAYHAGLPVPGGFAGVDVFFAISGFVITGSLLGGIERTHALGFGAFYARRVRRLLPALTVMLVAVTALGTLAAPLASQTIGAATAAAAALFSANVYLAHLGTGYFDVRTSLDPLLHTWTLGVEEQFYLAFPVVLAVAWKLGRRRGATLAVAAVTVASFLLASQFEGSRFAFYGSPARAWEFGLGALVALAAPLLARVRSTYASLAAVAGAALLDLGVFSLRGQGTLALALVVGGTCALIAAGCGSCGPVTRALGTRTLKWIGDRSYGWYLWHWPLIVYATALLSAHAWVAPTAAAVALGPAWLSYRYIETPVRAHVRLARRTAPALAVGCVAVALLAAGGLAIAHQTLKENARFAVLTDTRQLHADVVRGCDNGRALVALRTRGCTWRVPHARGVVVLIGDSNAGHVTEPVVRAANALGYDVTVATLSSCPVAGVEFAVDAATAFVRACDAFVRGTLATLVRAHPSLVLLAARDDRYIAQANVALGPQRARDPERKTRALRDALTATLRSLNASGVPVVVLAPIPRLPSDPAACAVLTVLRGACAGEESRSAVDFERSAAVAAETGAVAAAPAAWTLDLADALCSRRRCTTRHGRVESYRDEDHLSVAGAIALTPQFLHAIAAHAR